MQALFSPFALAVLASSGICAVAQIDAHVVNRTIPALASCGSGHA